MKKRQRRLAKINKTKSCFFDKINKIHKQLATFIKTGGKKSHNKNSRSDNLINSSLI